MDLRRLQADPAAFRSVLMIDTDAGPKLFSEVLDSWQAEDFAALDGAWRRVVGQDVEPRYQRAYLERPRGHAKTSDIAVSATWAMFASRRKLSGVVASGDKEQAGLIRDAIDKLLRLNPWLADVLTVSVNKITNKHTGSELVILSNDAPTSYGLTPDFVICDELTHWPKRDLWDSLLSATAKRRHCLLLVIANAGFEESWQWETREAIRTDPAWYFHRLDGPAASWITAERLEEQRRLLPGKVYRRLWLNEWTEGSGDALETADIDAAVTLQCERSKPERGWCYLAGLDIGLRRDSSGLVILGKHVGWREAIKPEAKPRPSTIGALVDLGLLEAGKGPETEYKHHPGTGRLKVAAVRIWTPAGGRRVSLEVIEKEILTLAKRFNLSSLNYDPHQAEYLAERLAKANIWTNATNFTGAALQEMASATLDAFRERRIDIYPHTALLADLRVLRVVERQYGFRLESPRRTSGDETRHGDAATALAIAVRAARQIRVPALLTRQRRLVLNP